jgi:glycosyl transferase family 25
MNALVINLNRSKDRLDFMSQQLDRLNIKFKRIEAVDANNMDDDLYQKNAYGWNRVLRYSEIACFFSHKKAWEIVVNKDEPYVIFEDDVILSEGIEDVLSVIKNYKNCHFINLETSSRKKLIHKKAVLLSNKFSLKQIFHNKTGASAYILWPKYARLLLSNYEQKGAALADAALFDNYFKLPQYQLVPAVAIQVHECTNFGINEPFKHFSHIANTPKPKIGFSVIFKLRRIRLEIIKIFVYIFNFNKGRLLKINFDRGL